MSKTTFDEHSKKIGFEANTPDLEEVASIARNFRFFFGDKEPTQFQKILTKVRRRTEDEWANGYLDWLGGHYKTAMKSSQVSATLGLPVTNKAIMDLWFNSEFFHSEKAKIEELADIHAVIGEVASFFQLYVAVTHCSSIVKALYTVVHLLDAEHPFVYSPNHHFG